MLHATEDFIAKFDPRLASGALSPYERKRLETATIPGVRAADGVLATAGAILISLTEKVEEAHTAASGNRGRDRPVMILPGLFSLQKKNHGTRNTDRARRRGAYATAII